MTVHCGSASVVAASWSRSRTSPGWVCCREPRHERASAGRARRSRSSREDQESWAQSAPSGRRHAKRGGGMTGYGVFVHKGRTRVGYRTGDVVYDLTAAEREELVDGLGTFQNGALNDFLALGPPQWTVVAQQAAQLPDRLAVPLDETEPAMPFRVADYVDFYSSENHAANVGRIFRPGQPPVLPNWRHLPVGYHGRAGTVVVSGTPIVRPSGQRGPGDVGPSQRLDIEAELGFVVGVPSQLGN